MKCESLRCVCIKRLSLAWRACTDIRTRPGVQDRGMQISLVYPVVGRCHVRESPRPLLRLFAFCIIGSAGIAATREESRKDYLSSLFLSLNKK